MAATSTPASAYDRQHGVVRKGGSGKDRTQFGEKHQSDVEVGLPGDPTVSGAGLVSLAGLEERYYADLNAERNGYERRAITGQFEADRAAILAEQEAANARRGQATETRKKIDSLPMLDTQLARAGDFHDEYYALSDIRQTLDLMTRKGTDVERDMALTRLPEVDARMAELKPAVDVASLRAVDTGPGYSLRSLDRSKDLIEALQSKHPERFARSAPTVDLAEYHRAFGLIARMRGNLPTAEDVESHLRVERWAHLDGATKGSDIFEKFRKGTISAGDVRETINAASDDPTYENTDTTIREIWGSEDALREALDHREVRMTELDAAIDRAFQFTHGYRELIAGKRLPR